MCDTGEMAVAEQFSEKYAEDPDTTGESNDKLAKGIEGDIGVSLGMSLSDTGIETVGLSGDGKGGGGISLGSGSLMKLYTLCG